MARLVPLVLLSLLQSFVTAQVVPTWPSPSTDELEDLMFLTTGYRAKNFADAITPCSKQSTGGSGPGRIAAAEWLRTTFHDAATGNVAQGIGGLDASIVYELRSAENVGTAFTSTITTYEPFFGPRLPMSEIIAIGTYASVRGCGGPAIPVRPGRIDARTSGLSGVPQPQDSIGTFQNRFASLGMNDSEMVAVTACGHSIGGVHGKNFPLIVADPDAFQAMDTSEAAFDERIATEYVDGTTTNPLVKGLSVQYSRNSDFVVNMVDNNATIRRLTDRTVFRNTCRAVLQKLIEVVPRTVTLAANPLTPYEVKPYGLQLYLQDGGLNFTFAGDIRVRTTNRAASSIASVQLVYKNRSGGSGSAVSTVVSGAAGGFDDSFSFYGFNTSVPTSTSISSFIVVISRTDGTTETFDNNGVGFPVSDSLLLQYPQSCASNPAAITITAAVRNTTSGTPTLNFLGRRYTSTVIVPTINTTSSALRSAALNVGPYAIFNLTLSLNATQSAKGHFNLTLPGSPAVDLTLLSTLPSTCRTLSATAAPSSSTPPATNTTTPSSYTSLGCVTDPFPSTPRVLSGPFTYSSTNMSTALCSTFCRNYALFGLEYGAECYCGNTLSSSSAPAPSTSTGCAMPCSGDATATCGGPNALSLYRNDAYVAPANPAGVGGWAYQGCWSDDVGDRTLTGWRVNDAEALTVEKCAAVCDAQEGMGVMGLEYGAECYCGIAVGGQGTQVAEDGCNMVCSGNGRETCGGPARLSLYVKGNGTGSSTGGSSNARRWVA
ncbi:uncharacterized protein HMPREF1541_00531 [Cyphellophora europaea CBS 101466]|uniref:WSC domain-containing protein n=1 Tax=Cyphellophora europaea (strain CBS 101466) TaxID=1220924 RepID=W2SCC1_CYPE1|nr:uncharacterized protein HMPREF1541_00531 [Cyphellophora europaea CBS 101466]ETN46347.1 hypothetical protein HMPREF1541_00531 [Cyphellophora europaea CBS 101466]